MSPRTRQTFAKRQKEQARQEKQRAKAARRQQKKLDNQALAERGPGAEESAESESAPGTEMDNQGPEILHQEQEKEYS